MRFVYLHLLLGLTAASLGGLTGCGDDDSGGNQSNQNNQNAGPDAGIQGASHLVGQVFEGATRTPLSGVRLSAPGLAFTAESGPDGRFVIPVDEPGDHVVTATREGYAFAIRRIRSTPGHVKAVPPIHLAPLDPVVTEIPATGGQHASSDGKVEVDFAPGSLAGPAQVRTTQFVGGKVLPAALPPLTQVTTAVEVDLGAGQLAAPTTLRVRNDFGFAPGTPVPVGWLDRETGKWHAEGMGTVTDDGQFLEYEASHFSCFDLNFPSIVDGHPAEPEAEVGHADEPEDCGASAVGLSSGDLTITHTTPAYQSLGTARALTLAYRSRTVRPGADVQLRTRVPVDDSGYPYGLTPDRVKIILDVEGRYQEVSFEGTDQDTAHAYRWDGVNGLGAQVGTGLYLARVEVIRYFSQAEYATATCFGCPPLESLGIPTTEPVPLSSRTEVPIPIDDRSESPIGVGWGIAGHRQLFLDGGGAHVMVTDGGAPARTYTLDARADRVAGTGEEPLEPAPTGSVARDVGLWEPHGVAAGPDGSVYLSDRFGLIWRVDPAGQLTRIAGTDTPGYSGDGGPATAAQLASPEALAVDGTGALLIAERSNHVIRRIDGAGIITTVAGDGTDGWDLSPGEGDGQAATSVALYDPRGLAADAAGNVFFADGHGCVRRVSPTGVLSTLSCDLLGPGGLAVDADGTVYAAVTGGILSLPTAGPPQVFSLAPRPGFAASALVVAAPGSLYVLDAGRHQVCRVDADGTYTRIAGQETTATDPPSAPGGDGGPATELPLHLAAGSGLALAPDGTLLVANAYHHTIVRVAPGAPTEGAAVFRSAPGDRSTLERQADGTYRLWVAPDQHERFDADGRHSASVDALGNETTYQHDAEGRLTRITDPVGQETVLAYDGAGRLASITDPAGRATTLAHDGDGRLTSVTDPLGRVTGYGYDGPHLVTKTDVNAQTTTYVYSGDRVTRVDLPTGETRQYERDGLPGDVAEIPAGEGTDESPVVPVPAGPREVRRFDGEGNVTTLRLDASGRVAGTVDPLGRVTTKRYDRHGQVVSVTGPDGIELQIARGSGSYRLRGVPRQIRRWNESEYQESMPVSLTYDDDLGKVTTITTPGEIVIATSTHQVTYGENGYVRTTTDPLGAETTFESNAHGQPTRITDATLTSVTLTYDARGNLATVTDDRGRTVTLERDAAGEPIRILDGLNRPTALERDALGRVTAVTDPASNRTTYGYEDTCGACGSAGKPTRITDPLNRTWALQYDAVGQLAAVTDPEGGIRRFEYDLARRLISVTEVDLSVTSYERDAAGRVSAVTDGDGRTTTIGYDVADRVTSVADDQATLSATYDAFGFPTQVRRATTAGDTFTTDYSVSTWNGLLTSTRDPDGRVRTLEYDGRHAVKQAFQDSTTDPDWVFWYEYTYDDAGRLTARIMTDSDATRSFRTTYGYDAAGGLQRIAHANDSSGSVWQTQLTTDAAGRIAALDTTDGRLDYTHDAADRLTAVAYSGASTLIDEAFTYDAVGNRIGSGQEFGTLDRLTRDATFTYAYDARGRLTSRTHLFTGEELILHWNDRDQLEAAERYDGSATLVMSATYTYDAQGRRLAKEVDGVRTQLDWTGYAPAGLYDDGGTPEARWHRCPVTGEVIGLEQGAYRGLAFSDHLGSPRAVAGYASGGVDWQAEYPAYGDAEVDPAATVEMPLRFPGQVLDEETGLHYNVFRYYDPASGRYVSPDPVWNESESRYAYVGGRPGMMVDPLGLEPPPGYQPISDLNFNALINGYSSIPGNPSGAEVRPGRPNPTLGEIGQANEGAFMRAIGADAFLRRVGSAGAAGAKACWNFAINDCVSKCHSELNPLPFTTIGLGVSLASEVPKAVHAIANRTMQVAASTLGPLTFLGWASLSWGAGSYGYCILKCAS